MTTPDATLDRRFSDDDAAAVPWPAAQQRLAAAQVAWVVTVRPDGRPHATPLVPVWLEDTLYFHTGADEQKFVNLRANPRVLVLAGDTRWDAGLDVVVEGTARQVTDVARLHAVAKAFGDRWDGRWQIEVRDGGFAHAGARDIRSVAFAVTPDKAFAHAKGDPFGQSAYRF